MIEAFKKRLLNAPATDAVNLAQLAIANNRMALVWARMFLAAARRADVLGHVMWPFASSLQFLRSSDTRKDAIDAIAAVYSTVNSADKRQFEDAVFALPFKGYENPERPSGDSLPRCLGPSVTANLRPMRLSSCSARRRQSRYHAETNDRFQSSPKRVRSRRIIGSPTRVLT